ncbi:MAG: hypothetical protein ACR2P7_01065 [bacterium]
MDSEKKRSTFDRLAEICFLTGMLALVATPFVLVFWLVDDYSFWGSVVRTATFPLLVLIGGAVPILGLLGCRAGQVFDAVILKIIALFGYGVPKKSIDFMRGDPVSQKIMGNISDSSDFPARRLVLLFCWDVAMTIFYCGIVTSLANYWSDQLNNWGQLFLWNIISLTKIISVAIAGYFFWLTFCDEARGDYFERKENVWSLTLRGILFFIGVAFLVLSFGPLHIPNCYSIFC